MKTKRISKEQGPHCCLGKHRLCKQKIQTKTCTWTILLETRLWTCRRMRSWLGFCNAPNAGRIATYQPICFLFTLIALEFLNVIALARAAGSFAAGRFPENLCMFLRAANSKELCDCMCLLACWLGWFACLSACFWWSGCSCWFAWSALSGWAGSIFISK